MENRSIFGCTVKYYSSGFCKKHYDKNRRHGDPLFERITFKGKPCTIEGCQKPVAYNKRCAMHSMQVKRANSPELKAKEVQRTKVWRLNNPELHRAHLSARGKRLRQSTPAWVDTAEIVQIYLRRDPETEDVDHIIPITHEAVCGLHVPWNLQILDRSSNESKKNSFDFTYDNNSWRKVSKKTP